ncbi:MAG: zinc-dependent metalloprotease, partial [Bacteroidota bacterium]|nr:zinc-dependent metalloprotease [Bacteroidota bacterium]
DKWALKWGYTYTGESDVEKDKLINNKWIVENLKNNPRLWFGGEGRNADPRAQTEDLSDNNVKASEYGIKNLKRILPELPVWTVEEADHYENLSDMYAQLIGQFNRYMGHVTKNVGGVYETFKSVEEAGNVYEPTPKAMQKDAVNFLNKQLFETPTWLLDKNILNKISNPVGQESLERVQANTLNSLLDGQRLFRLVESSMRFGAGTYSLDEMMTDVRKGIWSELATKKAIDPYRRNLQKVYVEKLISLINPPAINPAAAALAAAFGGAPPVNISNTDVTSVARGELKSLQSEINAAIPGMSDKMSKYHLQDMADRIKEAFTPGK